MKSSLLFYLFFLVMAVSKSYSQIENETSPIYKSKLLMATEDTVRLRVLADLTSVYT